MGLKKVCRLALLTFFALTVPCFAAGEAHAGDVALPPGTLNAEQVVNLFSNKTVDSVTAVQGRRSVSYYDPSGEVRQLRKGIKRTGRWRVTDNGRMCLQMEDRPEKCRIIVNENGRYKKFIVKKNGRHQHSVSYETFRIGNVMGL